MQSNQLASLERKASEYEDIYSRLEVRQAKEEKEETSPMVERSDEMKTLREYQAKKISHIWPPGGGQSYISSMLTLLPFNVGIFLLVDIVDIDNVDIFALFQPNCG